MFSKIEISDLRPVLRKTRNQHAPNLLMLCERIDGTYAINFLKTLDHLHTNGTLNYTIYIGEDIDKLSFYHESNAYIEINAYDIIVASRIASNSSLAIARAAVTNGIPFITHLDDLIFDMPENIDKRYTNYYDKNYISQLKYIIEKSTCIWTSTDKLAKALQDLFPGKIIKVLPGVNYREISVQRLALSWVRRIVHARRHRLGKITLGFMGSQSHQIELDAVAPALSILLNKYSNLRIEILGCKIPRELNTHANRVKVHGRVADHTAMIERLYELGWDIGLIPLFDNKFNQSKTITKFVEYTMANIPAIASAVGAYSDEILQNCLQRVDPGQDPWITSISRWIDEPQVRNQFLHNAKIYCRKNFNTTNASNKILEVINESVLQR